MVSLVPPRRGEDRLIVAVHSSDVHVNDAYVPPEYGGDGTAGLAAVLEAARAVEAQLVLLAGDTFEHNRLGDEIVARAAALLAGAEREVVILPGNHDPAIAESVHHRLTLPNVHVLGVTHDDHVTFPALDLEVWGHAHRDYGDMMPFAAHAPRSLRWRIAVAHGHYEPIPASLGPIRPGWLFGDAEIDALDVDYLALGHWNRAVRVGRNGLEAHYSGSPDYAGTVNVVRLSGAGVEVTREALRLPGAPSRL
jgi:DNA repair exonuclease SbcCD nuclease subunit